MKELSLQLACAVVEKAHKTYYYNTANVLPLSQEEIVALAKHAIPLIDNAIEKALEEMHEIFYWEKRSNEVD